MAENENNPGTTLVEKKTNVSINNLADNKTIFITKLTDEEQISPEINSKSSTMKDVFEHYKPFVNLTFKDKNENPVEEKINFENLGDFGKSGIIKKSNFLQQLELEKRDYQSLYNVIKSNKIFEKVLSNPESKDAYIAVLKDLISEIESSENK